MAEIVYKRFRPAKEPPAVKPVSAPVPQAQEPAKTAAPSAAGETQRRQTGLERMMEGPGASLARLPITANYIAVRCKNDGVHHYAVSFSPAIDNKGMRFRMVNEHKDVIGEVKAFDGASLFLPIRLPNVETFMTSERPTDGEKITLCVKLVRVLPPESCVQIYNIIFRRLMIILKMCKVVKSFYVTSIREYEGGLMLLSDVNHRVLRTSKDLATQRQIALRKFCENVNTNPEARTELEKWGLELDRDTMEISISYE